MLEVLEMARHLQPQAPHLPRLSILLPTTRATRMNSLHLYPPSPLPKLARVSLQISVGLLIPLGFQACRGSAGHVSIEVEGESVVLRAFNE